MPSRHDGRQKMTVLEQRAMDAVCRIPGILEDISKKMGAPATNVMTVGCKAGKVSFEKPTDADLQGLVCITVDDPEIRALGRQSGSKNTGWTAQAVAEKIFCIMRKAHVARDIKARLCERIEQEFDSFSWNDEDIDRMAEHFLRSEDPNLSYWQNVDAAISFGRYGFKPEHS